MIKLISKQLILRIKLPPLQKPIVCERTLNAGIFIKYRIIKLKYKNIHSFFLDALTYFKISVFLVEITA